MSTPDVQPVQFASALDARQAHLSLLGIKQWYSRYKLARAGRTPDELFAEPGVVGAAALVEKQSGLGADGDKLQSPPNVVARQDLDAFAQQLKPSAQGLSGKQNESRDVLLEESYAIRDLNLSLCMVTCGRSLIFYEGRASELEAKEHSFLSSFLKFVLNGSSQWVDSCYFEWPIFGSAVLRMDQLRYFNEAFSRWAGRSDWSSVRYVFYFGYHFDVLEQGLLDIKIGCDSDCVFVPIKLSLAEILSAPIKKRGLWDTIASLPRQ